MFTMINRRNYYRMLNVQPDASADVIRASYRALLQKLKLHPDLGGEPWYASHINRAYNVLRNPEKRAAYDKKLLTKYCIKTLSTGGLELKPADSSGKQQTNQRNYYRVLQVQIDSPQPLIQSSYETLKKSTTNSKDLLILEKAYQVLAQSESRKKYDQWLSSHGHQYAVKKLKGINTKEAKKTFIRKNTGFPNHIQPAAKQAINATLNSAYQPIIQRYCKFCKTPYAHSPGLEDNPLCVECNSPLELPGNFSQTESGRQLGRLQSRQLVTIFQQWPDKGMSYPLINISPTGLKIETDKPYEIASVIKLDAENFKAVAEIIYCESHKNAYHVGMRLLSAKYLTHKGQFFAARA